MAQVIYNNQLQFEAGETFTLRRLQLMLSQLFNTKCKNCPHGMFAHFHCCYYCKDCDCQTYEAITNLNETLDVVTTFPLNGWGK